MAVQIGARPDAGFDNPLGMLKDCHRRVEWFLDVLYRVARRAHGRPLDAEETNAVQAALLYFRTSGPRHTRDEEDSLFPRLRALASTKPLAAQLLEELARLEADHGQASQLHDETDRLFTRWIAEGALSPPLAAQLDFATGELARIYSTHIAVEEGLVFRHAAELFSPRELEAMGHEFRARRAVES